MPLNDNPVTQDLFKPDGLPTNTQPLTPDLTNSGVPTPFEQSEDRLESFSQLPAEDYFEVLGSTRKSNPITTQLNRPNVYTTDELSPLAKRYSTFYPEGVDNEELAAKGQSWYEKWANGLVKFGSFTLGTFAQSFLTIPDTVNAISSGKFSDLYTSDIESGIDKWLKNLEDQFPNYYSQWEREHPFLSALPFSGGAANFWSDKVVKNLGFAAGAIAGAVVQDLAIATVTGGIGEIPLVSAQIGKAALWLNKIFTGTDRVGELLNTAKSVGKSADHILKVERLAQLAANQRVTKSARYAMNLYGAARTEAAIEARDGYNTLKEDLIADYKETHGGMSPGMEDLKKIEAYTTASSNVRFGINLALLLVSDSVQFSNFLKPFNIAKQGVRNNLEKQGVRLGVKEGSLDTIESISPSTRMGKIWAATRPTIPNIFTEGFIQEGGQFATAEGIYDYYKNKYNGKIKGDINDIMNSVSHGLEQEFGTTEGWENIFLGSITGALFGAGKKRIDSMLGNGDRQQRQAILNLLNSKSLTGTLKSSYDRAVNSAAATSDMEQAVKQNDLFAYKNLSHHDFFDFIHSGLQAGRFDVRIEQLKMLRELDKDQFEKMFDMDMSTANRRTAAEYIDSLISKAENIKSIYNAVDSTYRNPFKHTRTPKNAIEEQETLNHNSFNEYKSQLAYLASFDQDVNNRLFRMQSRLHDINIDLQNDLVARLTNKEELAELQKEYDEMAKILAEVPQNATVEQKKQLRDQAKVLSEAASDITNLLSKTDLSDADFASVFLPLFDKILHLELNGRTADRTTSIGRDKMPDIVTTGIDVNRLKNRKKRTSEVFDTLLTQEGFEKFMSQAEQDVPTPDASAAANIETIKVKTKDGEEELEIGTEYYLGKVTELSKEGKEVYRFPTLKILGLNADGTIKIQDGNGKVRDVSPDVLADYKLGKVSDTKGNKKAKFFMDNANSIFQFNFGKGKKINGRLQYSPKEGILLFMYKGKDGKTRSIEVTGDQFVPKKGYQNAVITKIGELTAEQKKTLEEFAAEQDARLQEKRKARLEVIEELVDETSARLEEVDKLLSEKKTQLDKVRDDLQTLEEQIKTAEFTKRNNFKKVTTRALKAANQLSNLKEDLTQEIEALENEKEELEINQTYFYDLAQNIDELPSEGQEFIDELRDQAEQLEKLVIDTGTSISKIRTIIVDLDEATQDAIDVIHDAIDKFEAKYPKTPTNTSTQEFVDFIRANPNFLKLNPEFRSDLAALEKMIAKAEDAVIAPNQKGVQRLTRKVERLSDSLKDLEKEYIARSAILKKFDDKIEEYRKRLAAEQKMAKDQALHQKLFQQQEQLLPESGTTITGDNTEDQKGLEPSKKNTPELYTATTAPSENLKPHHVREQVFFNNIDKFSNKANIVAITVTKKTETALGFNGLIDKLLEGTGLTIDPLDIDNGVIAVVYAEKKADGLYAVDKTGTSVGKLGTQINLNEAIYSVMPTTALNWPSGGPRYRAGEEEQARQFSQSWRAKREQLFGLTNDQFELLNFNISRGFPKTDDKQHSVIGTLVEKSDLDKKGLIQISTTGTISHQGKSINFPVGRPVLQNGSTLQFLNNRNFIPEEQETVYKSLKLLAKRASETRSLDQQLVQFLNGILYIGAPQQGKQAARNQIWLGGGLLHLGRNNVTVPFTEFGIEAARDTVMGFLAGTYNNINNTKLRETRFNQPYEEILGIDEQGKIQSIIWKTYQHYLLSDTYDLVESDSSDLKGKHRDVAKIPLTTQVRPIDPNIEDDYNFEQKYAVMNNLDLPVQEAKKEEKKATVTPAPTANKETPKFILDGTTKNTFIASKGEEIFYYGTDPAELKIENTDGYKAVIKRISEAQNITPDEADTKLRQAMYATIIKSQGQQPVAAQPKAEEKSAPEEFIVSFLVGLMNKQGLPSTLGAVDYVKNTLKLDPENASLKEIKEAAQKRMDEMVAQRANQPQNAPDALKNKKPPSKEAEYRRILNLEVQRMTSESRAEFKKWHQENVPGIPFKYIDHIIETTDGGFAWGALQRGMAQVFELGEIGTDYHEAFEGVWKYFLPEADQKAIIDEFRKRQGTFKDRVDGSQIEYSQATDLQAKERIADEFVDFRDSNKKPKGIIQKLAEFFQGLVDFFREFFTGNRNLAEKLFKRINRGYYRDHVVDPMITDKLASYRVIEGLNEQLSNELNQDVTARIFQNIFAEGKSLFSFDKITSKSLYQDVREDLENDGAVFPDSTWDQIVELNKEFLKTFNIVFDEEDQFSINEENANKNDYERDAFKFDAKKNAPSAIKLLIASLIERQEGSLKQNSKTTSLAEINKVQDALTLSPAKLSSSNGYQLVRFDRTFVKLLENLSNSRDVNHMMEKLVDLAKDEPNMVALYKRLKGNLTTGKIEYDKLNTDDWRLLIAFFNTFSKQKPDAFIQYIEQGKVYTAPANLNTVAKQVEEDWLTNMKVASDNANSIVIFNKETLEYGTSLSKIEKIPIRTLHDKLGFLTSAGVLFPEEAYDRLSKTEKDQFDKAVEGLKTGLKTATNTALLTSSSLGISKPINTLSKLYAKSANPNTNAVRFNTEGEKTQLFVQNNALSHFTNIFNQLENTDQINKDFSYLNDWFSKNSLILKPGGQFFNENGKRIKDLNVSLIDGTVNKSKSVGKPTSKLSFPDRLVQEINQNLKGNYYILVPADSKTEWMLNLGNHISFSEFNSNLKWNRIYNIFQGYLADEMRMIREFDKRTFDNNEKKKITQAIIDNVSRIKSSTYQLMTQVALDSGENLQEITDTAISQVMDNGQSASENVFGKEIVAAILEYANTTKTRQLRFFKDILSEEMAKEAVDYVLDFDYAIKGAEGFIDKYKDAINLSVKEFILNTVNRTKEDLIKSNKIIGEGTNFQFPSLDSDFVSENGLSKTMNENQINNILEFVNTNYIINNVELHKIFFGDPNAIKDETKRVKQFLSPRATTFELADFDNFANVQLNKVGKATLTAKDFGYHEFKNYSNTATVQDPPSIGSFALQEDNEFKALYEKIDESDGQSWMSLPAYREMRIKSGNWLEEHEDQYQYEMAYTRSQLNKRGFYEYSSSELQKADGNILDNFNPRISTWDILKPIGSGPKADKSILDVFQDKTSTFPMVYRAIEGTVMEKMMIKMFNEGIDYIIPPSGRKIGVETVEPIYNGDGSFSNESFQNIIKIPHRYWGIQVENQSKGETKSIRGSQATKLVTMDLMEQGVPVDFISENKIGDWQNLSEKEKEEKSPIYKLIKENQRFLEGLTSKGYDELLDKLGLVEEEGNFRITDHSKAAKTLRDEMFRRELSDNVKDSVSLNLAGTDFNIPFEASPAYQTIKNILYSMVDKAIMSPKVNGGSKVQVSPAMFEKNNRQAVYKSGKEWKNVENYDSLTAAQKATVRLTSSELKFYEDEDGKRYCEVLLPHWFARKLRTAKSKMDDEAILNYLNTTEEGKKILTGFGFRIPTQGTSSMEVFRVKGFLPQEMGDTIVVPAEITKKAGSDFDVDKLNVYLKNVIINKEGFPELVKFIEDTTSDQALSDIFRYGYTQRTEDEGDVLIDAIFENAFKKQNQGLDPMKVNSKAAIENAYFETLEQLITLPQVFNRLVTPSSSGPLKELRDELNKAKGLDKQSTSLLDRNYLAKVRHNFISGKNGVGIAAVQQTSHSLSQRSVVYIDPNRLTNIDSVDKLYLGDLKINLPHNTIKMEGEDLVTLSAIKDKAGEYISDKNSWYITGYVDVSKDAFIIELGAKPAIAPTFLFLERAGVPTRDVVFFMNQPIIQDYLDLLESENLSWLFNQKKVQAIKDRYPSKTSATELNVKNLKVNIEKRRDGGLFTQEENAEQKFILDEFLKYSKMAAHLFELNQGSNYDTANLSDPSLVGKKIEKTRIAREQNIFSSVDKILDNSFIGHQAEHIIKSRDAISSFLKLDSPEARAILDPIINVFVQRGIILSDKDFQNISRSVVTSFIDYLVQTNTGLNSRIKELVIESNTAVANEFYDLKRQLSKQGLTDLYNNPVIQAIQPIIDNRPGKPRTMRLRTGDNNAYTANLYTGALRELKDNVHTKQLYGKIVRLALLQGSTNSPFSFTSLIPLEDYARVVKPLVDKFASQEDVANFATNAAFFRNNWQNDDIVPTVKVPSGVSPFFPNQVPAIFAYVPEVLKKLGVGLIQLSEVYNSMQVKYPVVKVVAEDEFTGEQEPTRLYKQVQYPDGSPLITSDAKGNTQYIYKPINAWGPGAIVQEYYTDGRMSVFNNFTRKYDEELADEVIVQTYTGSILQVENEIDQVLKDKDKGCTK